MTSPEVIVEADTLREPVYEVGPASWSRPGLVVVDYDETDKVSPERFGLRHDPTRTWNPGPHGGLQRVPVAHLVALQDYVYTPHVHNLATVPSTALDERAERTGDLPDVALVDGQFLLGHGHHRACAALLRGDTDFLAVVYSDAPTESAEST